MNQKLSDWSSLAEIVSAVAIVISLIYVGIQVTESTRAVRSATANETAATISNWYMTLGASPETAETYARAMEDPESVSRGEFLQFMYLSHGILTQYQAAYYTSEEGTLDVELRESLTNVIAGVREMPGFLTYWSQRRTLFEPGFREFIDDLLARGVTNSDLETLYRSNSRSQQ